MFERISSYYKRCNKVTHEVRKRMASKSRHRKCRGNQFFTNWKGDKISERHFRTFFSTVRCDACRVKGHYKPHCPVVDVNGNHIKGAGLGTLRDTGGGSDKTDAETVSKKGVCLTASQNEPPHIDPNWILLDSESNVTIFCNPDLLSDIVCDNVCS